MPKRKYSSQTSKIPQKDSSSTPSSYFAFLNLLSNDYPDYVFKIGSRSHFHYPKTIVVSRSESNFELVTLHELSHALLKHASFTTDIDRLKKETAAWSLAKKLAKKYSVKTDEDFIESELDTYRDWLHSRSKCPICGLTRFETENGSYHCPHCENFK